MKIILDRFKTIADLCRNKTVLDIGCIDHDLNNRKKSTWLHKVLCNTAASVTGLDNDSASVDQLRSEGYRVICADATNFNLSQTFDVIVAGEIIEHLVNPAGFLACVKNHLKPEGVLVLTTPHAQGLIYCLQNLIFGRELENPDHVCFYTPRTLAVLMKKCGFEMLDAMYIIGMLPQGHTRLFFYLLSLLKNIIKFPFYLLRPSLCHRFLAVAKPVKS